MAIRLKFMILKAAEKMAARHSLPFRFALLDLPNELIVTILEHIDSRISLRHMSRTCRRMQKLTEPVLYRSALIRTGSETDKLVTALQARPARAAALHRLDIPCHQRYVQSFEGIAHLMEQASNLKELMIESPSCNSSDFEDEEAWEDMVRELFRPFQIAVDAATAITPSKPLQKLHTRESEAESEAESESESESESLSSSNVFVAVITGPATANSNTTPHPSPHPQFSFLPSTVGSLTRASSGFAPER